MRLHDEEHIFWKLFYTEKIYIKFMSIVDS